MRIFVVKLDFLPEILYTYRRQIYIYLYLTIYFERIVEILLPGKSNIFFPFSNDIYNQYNFNDSK